MSLIITTIRNILGGIIVFFDLITRGTKQKRSPESQQKIEQEAESLTLYQFFACPFCIKTRRALHKMNIPISKRSVSKGSQHREELLQGGGKIQAPCLRIETEGEVKWLYDSSQIIAYFQQRFN